MVATDYILDNYKSRVTKDEYPAFMRSNSREETFKGVARDKPGGLAGLIC